MSSSRFQLLESRLNALHEAHKNTIQLINRLTNSKQQTSAHSESDLISEIHDNLKAEDEELDILRQELQDSTYSEATFRAGSEREKEQAALAVQVARLGEDFKHARARFRSAQVQSKRNAQLAKAQERQSLFTSKSNNQSDDGPIRRRTDRPRGTQDEAVTASEDVTSALRRTQRLLRTEVERSSFAQEIFNQSNETLKQLSTQYNDLDSLLASSRNLLSTLLTSQKSDTWYLETTFYLLVVTIGWLVFRRFLYGPLWWLVWLPTKLLYRLVFMVLGILGVFDKSASANSTIVSISSGPSVISSSSAFTMSSGQAKQSEAVQSEADRVNAGGDPSPEGSESQKVGQMAEESRKDEQKPVKLRGDGTPLVDSDAPRNPKKRMWEEQPAEKKEKDEL